MILVDSSLKLSMNHTGIQEIQG